MSRSNSIQQIAYDVVENLRQALIGLCKISAYQVSEKTNFTFNEAPSFSRWVYVISFMIRKISAHFLGDTDLDYDHLDFKFDVIKRNIESKN